MWKSVFLHEFPDDRMNNFSAIEGAMSADSAALTPHITGLNGTHSLLLSPNRGIGYQFTNSREDVIGFSATIELHFPAQTQDVLIPLLQIGTSIDLHFIPKNTEVIQHEDGSQHLVTNVDLITRVNGTSVVVGKLQLPHRNFVTIRVQCSNDGQVRVFQNGKLVSYRIQATVFSPLSVESIRFGFPTGSASPAPRYRMSLAFLRLLRREDKIAELGDWLPDVELPDDPLLARCVQRGRADLPVMIDKLREHMRSIRGNLASDWDNVSGAAISPFTQQGLLVHETAKKLVQVFRALLKDDGSAAPDDFIAIFQSLMTEVREQDSQAYKTLIEQLSQQPEFSDECREQAMQVLTSQTPELVPIATMLAEAAQTAKQLGSP